MVLEKMGRFVNSTPFHTASLMWRRKKIVLYRIILASLCGVFRERVGLMQSSLFVVKIPRYTLFLKIRNIRFSLMDACRQERRCLTSANWRHRILSVLSIWCALFFWFSHVRACRWRFLNTLEPIIHTRAQRSALDKARNCSALCAPELCIHGICLWNI